MPLMTIYLYSLIKLSKINLKLFKAKQSFDLKINDKLVNSTYSIVSRSYITLIISRPY